MQALPMYHKVRINNPNHRDLTKAPDIQDVVHVRSALTNSRGHLVTGRFDTVLIDICDRGSRTVSRTSMDSVSK